MLGEIIYLAPHVSFIEYSGNKIILFSEEFCFELSDNEFWVNDFLLELKNGAKLENIVKSAFANLKIELIRVLANHKFVLAENSYLPDRFSNTIFEKQIGWLSLHSITPILAQEKINKSRVAIVGLGGVGSIVLQHLISAGVSNLYLIDGDIVSTSNLNRQYTYTINDIGESKVQCSRDYALKINPSAKIHYSNTYINSSQDLDLLASYKPDLIICCADKPLGIIEEIVAEYCYENETPFSTAGVGLEKGYWGPTIIPKKTSCYPCFIKAMETNLTKEQLEILKAGKTIEEYSFGPINSMISSMFSREIILLLLGNDSIHSFGNRVFMNAITLEFNIKKTKRCVCWVN